MALGQYFSPLWLDHSELKMPLCGIQCPCSSSTGRFPPSHEYRVRWFALNVCLYFWKETKMFAFFACLLHSLPLGHEWWRIYVGFPSLFGSTRSRVNCIMEGSRVQASLQSSNGHSPESASLTSEHPQENSSVFLNIHYSWQGIRNTLIQTQKQQTELRHGYTLHRQRDTEREWECCTKWSW